jgi:hypothetical protein
MICLHSPGGCRPSVNAANLTKHRLDYKWQQTGTIDAHCGVTSLSWNLEGTRLLTAGDLIQMWYCPDLEPSNEQQDSEKVLFTLGGPPSALATEQVIACFCFCGRLP